ncbi:MAG: lytic transglycosylase domain-containing protein [Gammaproteobacteria bacterium]
MQRVLAALALVAGCHGVAADELRLDLPVGYGLVRAALVEQIFIGPNATARVLEGKNACNILTLAEPEVEGGAGRIIVRTKIVSRGGTPLTQGRCLPLFEWTGILEATEEPQVLAGQRAIGFRVTDSKILNAEGESSAVPGVLWRWIKENVHPRLETLTVDVGQPLEAAATLLRESGADPVRIEPVLSSLRIVSAVASVETLDIGVALDAPPMPAGWTPPADEPPLTIEELAQWRAAWQSWDGFATWLVKRLAAQTSPALRDALAGILLDARHDLLDALAADSGRDPVRALFRKSWQRLRPLARDLGTRLPAGEALKLLSFVSAADVLETLDAAAPQLGFRVDRDALRRLARMLLPEAGDEVFAYTTDVDPELRELLGFEREPEPLALTQSRLLELLLPSAQAMVKVDPALGQKLQGWVPRPDDLDAFLAQVDKLLAAIAAAELARGKIEKPYVEIYRALLPATAYMETCWRQFEVKQGKVDTVQSPVGSVGIMQVNKHVWRGVYDLNALLGDAGYNARAGNEILVHYLVDYAIKRGEHQKTGNPDNLARATYAIYNGGPGHMTRYRKADARPALRKIDQAFFDKYKAVRRDGREAVKACYGR